MVQEYPQKSSLSFSTSPSYSERIFVLFSKYGGNPYLSRILLAFSFARVFVSTSIHFCFPRVSINSNLIDSAKFSTTEMFLNTNEKRKIS